MEEKNITKRQRRPSEVLKRGYSENEVRDIYALARAYIGITQFAEAEQILKGLTEVAPDFIPAHLALAYCFMNKEQLDEEVLRQALLNTKQALRIDPRNPEALILQIIILLNLNDRHAAGSFLGELGEQIESAKGVSDLCERLYRSQLERFQQNNLESNRKIKKLSY